MRTLRSAPMFIHTSLKVSVSTRWNGRPNFAPSDVAEQTYALHDGRLRHRQSWSECEHWIPHHSLRVGNAVAFVFPHRRFFHLLHHRYSHRSSTLLPLAMWAAPTQTHVLRYSRGILTCYSQVGARDYNFCLFNGLRCHRSLFPQCS